MTEASSLYRNDDPLKAGAMNLQVSRFGEIIGGSQCEEYYDVLLGRRVGERQVCV